MRCSRGFRILEVGEKAVPSAPFVDVNKCLLIMCGMSHVHAPHGTKPTPCCF